MVRKIAAASFTAVFATACVTPYGSDADPALQASVVGDSIDLCLDWLESGGEPLTALSEPGFFGQDLSGNYRFVGWIDSQELRVARKTTVIVFVDDACHVRAHAGDGSAMAVVADRVLERRADRTLLCYEGENALRNSDRRVITGIADRKAFAIVETRPYEPVRYKPPNYHYWITIRPVEEPCCPPQTDYGPGPRDSGYDPPQWSETA